MEIFNDKPVSTPQQDDFQRYPFAKRIASLVNKGNFSTSQVIGIYGKWGEGKTSVINFIKEEIVTDVVIVSFNPWNFQDEKSLVKSFFEHIASALGKKLVNSEGVIKAFEDYSDALGAIANTIFPYGLGAIFGAGKKIASRFKKAGLPELKANVEVLIMEANTNFVVFIDDIDRLNIEEIQAVFRLVKLTGDFARFSYILAFDDDLIAASLGHRYGGKQKQDGYAFLEKIIQLPLQLPKANAVALRKYSLNLIIKVLAKINVALEENEIREFYDKYDIAFLPVLKNPRLGVRYANAIGFAIPLLLGEIYVPDLMIIEGVKIFYPELYYFIRHNDNVFLSMYSSEQFKYEGGKKEAADAINRALKIYDENLQPRIKEMLMELFPQLKNLYLNQYLAPNCYEIWYRERRICSTYYFERYFSYVVTEGDISDIYFKGIFSNSESLTPESLAKKLKSEFLKLERNDFIFKLRMMAEAFEVSESNTICIALAMIGDAVPVRGDYFIFSPRDEMAKIITILIRKFPIKERRFFCTEAIIKADSFHYALLLHFRFTQMPATIFEESFLSPDDAKEIKDVIISRFQAENKKVHVLRDFPEDDLHTILLIYLSAGREEEIKGMLKQEMNNDPQFPLKLIKMFTPTIYSSVGPSPFKSGFNKIHYESLTKFIDPEIVYSKITAGYGIQNPGSGINFDDRDLLSDAQLVELFQKVHKSIIEKPT